jgi:hypothetical protein
VPSIRIKVGASLDANALAVFQPLERAAKRARKGIEENLNAAGKSGAKSAKQVGTSWDALDKELDRMANDILRKRERADKAATRSAAQAAKERVRNEKAAEQQIAAAYTAAQRQKAQALRAAAAAARTANANVPWYARTIGGSRGALGSGGAIGIGRRAGIRVGRGAAMAYGYGGAALSGAMGVGMDIAHGLGVDTSLASLVSKSQQQQTLATKLSNAGYVPGTQLQDPRELLQEARSVSNETGIDTTEALDALRAFVAKTGDLQTGRDTLADMAKLSRATGTSLEDMANASAEVTNALGDMPNKAGVTKTIMQQIAGQGKLGAVEIRDMAKQMAKLAAMSHRFVGGVTANVSEMGIIAQEAKLRGGAVSATQAATSVVSFATDITKKGTLKGWTDAGLNPFADKGKTMLKSPEELIKEAVLHSKGDLTKLNALFPNKMSGRAVQGFAAIYGETQGTEREKIAAVTAEFERLRRAQLDDAEVNRAFAESMKTSEAQVTVFNNHMDEAAEQLAGALMPAFAGLSKTIIPLSQSFGNWLGDITGQKRENALDLGGKAVVGNAASIDRLNRGAREGTAYEVGGPTWRGFMQGTGVAGGHKVTQYSEEELMVMRNQGAKLGANAGALQTQVEAEAEEVAGINNAARAARHGGNFARANDLDKDAAAAVGRLTADMGKLNEMYVEIGKNAEATKMVYTAVSEGSAEIVSAIQNTAKPSDGVPSGIARPDSPVDADE